MKLPVIWNIHVEFGWLRASRVMVPEGAMEKVPLGEQYTPGPRVRPESSAATLFWQVKVESFLYMYTSSLAHCKDAPLLALIAPFLEMKVPLIIVLVALTATLAAETPTKPLEIVFVVDPNITEVPPRTVKFLQ